MYEFLWLVYLKGSKYYELQCIKQMLHPMGGIPILSGGDDWQEFWILIPKRYA
jgi:hypothetical protein